MIPRLSMTLTTLLLLVEELPVSCSPHDYPKTQTIPSLSSRRGILETPLHYQPVRSPKHFLSPHTLTRNGLNLLQTFLETPSRILYYILLTIGGTPPFPSQKPTTVSSIGLVESFWVVPPPSMVSISSGHQRSNTTLGLTLCNPKTTAPALKLGLGTSTILS